MQTDQFDLVKAQVTHATAYQILILEDLIHLAGSQQFTEMALARRTKRIILSRLCPHCASNNVVLHGKDQNKRQRFKCRGCRRTYNVMTGTPMARARKPEKWGPYLRCMTEHMPVRDIVETGIGLNHVTAWRWRHRFLEAAANDNAATLSGVIQVDQTFFNESFKGSRGWKKGTPPAPRPPRRRARDATVTGSPQKEVPVLTALDSGGAIFNAVLSSQKGIEVALDGRIAANSVLCTGVGSGYVNAANQANAEHYIISRSMTAPRKRLGLSRVIDHHDRLKCLINERCFGVATRLLGNYLGWHRAMIRRGFKGTALLDRALA